MTKPILRTLFCGLTLLMFSNLCHAERPNIIVFMADDMGYADAGFTGSTDIKTPNLDKLAASGVTFTKGYSELHQKWAAWNEANVPCRLLGYKDYHKKRDLFFGGAIPKPAAESGYEPKVKPTLK